MDPKNEFELDVTMESKCHYKLRSSLKKRKSRNPLGSLDVTEVTADTTLAPPLRRVSFAASNYVKPFLDDPEKNTIWDNTYEEEVNHTDSTKSENTNHTNLSEQKSHYQEITNVDIQKEHATNIYCDQGVEDMQVSCFNQTMIDDECRNNLDESNLDLTSCILPNIDTTKLSKETTFNMELTCQWKNNIIQSSVAHDEVPTSEYNLLRNSTVRQEQDMSMTYCFNNIDIEDNKLSYTSSAQIVCDREKVLPDQSEMEFTCAFSTNVLERVNQHRETAPGTSKGAKIDKGNIATGYSGKEVLVPEQSGMDFTCVFLDKENFKQLQQAEQDAKTTEGLNVIDKENVLPFFAENKKVYLPDQSGMEYTCTFPINILEKVEQSKQSGQNAKTTEGLHLVDKENLVPVLAENKKVYLPDQSGMEYTCAFPINILEKVEQSKQAEQDAKTTEGLNVIDKENLVPVFAENKKVYLADQSGMEYTCAFPINIWEKVEQSKQAGQDAKTAEGLNVIDKENLVPVFGKNKKVYLPDQSAMDFTSVVPPSHILETSNQFKETERDLKMAKGLHFENKENLPDCPENNQVFLSNQSGIGFKSAFPNSTLQTVNQSKGIGDNPSTVVTETVKLEDNKNTVTFIYDQNKTRLTCEWPNNILELGNQSKGTENNPTGVNVKDKENISHLISVYTKEEKIFTDQSQMDVSCWSPNKTSQKHTPSYTENCSLRMQGLQGMVQNKENVLSGDVTGCPSEINQTKSCPHQSAIEYTSSFSNKILEITGQPKKNPRLKEIVISKNIESKNVYLPNKNQSLDTYTSSLPANEKECEIEFGKINKEHSASRSFFEQVQCQELTRTDNQLIENCEMVHSTLNNCEFKNTSDLLSGDVNTLNTYTINNENSFKSNSAPSNKSSESQGIVPIMNPPRESIVKNIKATQSKLISVEPNVNTDFIKPVKVREFGNIPVAVDVTDLSIDLNTIDHVKSVIDTSRHDYGLKENTYTVRVGKPDKKSEKLNEETFVHQEVNASRRDNVQLPKNLIVKTQFRDPASTQSDQNMINRNRNQDLKINKVNSLVAENIVSTEPKPYTEIPLSEKIKQNNSEVLSSLHSPNKHKEFKENNIDPEASENHIRKIPFNVGGNQTENKEKDNVEERYLFDSMEASILIDSLTLLDEPEHKSEGVNFSPNEMHDASVQNEDQNHEVKEAGCEKVPVTKVIYSEPMKVNPFNEEFPSMQTSGMNPFNFTSIASMEDTQQLIQATFSKPSFIKDQFDDKWHSGFVPEPSMLETTGNNEINRTDTTLTQNETLKAESILKNIHKKLVRCKFQPVDYQEIADSIRTHHDIRDKMEKLLLNFKFPEIPTFALQEKTKKMSLGNVSYDGSGNESISEVLDGGEDNCDKSVLLESNLSLHEKIVNVCKRSNNLIKIRHFEDCCYFFSTVHECVLIYVSVHPDDGRVTEIKAASSLDDSMDILNHFLVKNILDKLQQSTLKSYLGPYYDVLSLLDHICLTVDEVMEFYFEFLSLQRLYPTLRILSDYSISLEILHISPPIWWTIRLNMASVSKINPETLQLKSKWDRINEEHIKQILINIDEGVECLRSFISNVYKYFERTQLRYRVQEQKYVL